MKTDPLEVRIRKVLSHVAETGSYTIGHVLVIEEIINDEKAKVTEGIKTLLNINDCHCEG